MAIRAVEDSSASRTAAAAARRPGEAALPWSSHQGGHSQPPLSRPAAVLRTGGASGFLHALADACSQAAQILALQHGATRHWMPLA